MFGCPIVLTTRASSMKRSSVTGSSQYSLRSTLTAARLPISGWVAEYTMPIPPSPSLPSIVYSLSVVPAVSSGSRVDGGGGGATVLAVTSSSAGVSGAGVTRTSVASSSLPTPCLGVTGSTFAHYDTLGDP